MLLINLLFATLAVAAPGSFPVVHEKRSSSRFNRNVGRSVRVERDAILPVRIALRQSNLDDGYDYLMDVSDPFSKNYGKHWTIDEIHAKFAPSDETIGTVKAWLVNFGISEDKILESTSRGWLGVDISAADAERLFETEYYEHYDADEKFDVGCDMYHVPSHLSHHIDFVTPGITPASFNKRTVHKSTPSQLERRAALPYDSLENCDDHITPACLKALYNVPDATLNIPGNELGIYEDYYDVYDQTDLNLYYRHFAPYVPQNTRPKLVGINNSTAPVSTKNGGDESVLDLDLAISLIYPQSVVLYQSAPTVKQFNEWASKVPGSDNNKGSYANARSLWEVLLEAVDGAFCTAADKATGTDCGTTELTTVLSVSYGTSELYMPEARTKRACSEYMKLGLKGHTIMFSSGDYGPANNYGCANPAHLDNAVDYNGTTFAPYWPAACPYITAVGATQLNHGETVNDPETVMYQPAVGHPDTLPYAIFGSAGGFSNYFPMPSYQKSAVDSYFANYDPGYKSYVYSGKSSVGAGGGKYAKGGRGIPDVSANGAHLSNFLHGALSGGFYGTSLSCPIWASFVTLINQERAKAGKGPVGFINPVLYAHPEVFNDITLGYAAGCLTKGWAAEPGWDPTTGLGTPNYPDLLAVFLALP